MRISTNYILSISLIVCIFIVSFILQFRVHMNHDVAWVVHSSGWLLEGKIFGKDVIAANPPLIWYFSIPPALASRLLPISEVIAFRCYAYLVMALLFTLSWRVLLPLRVQGQSTAAAGIVIAATFCALVGVGRDFGQREVFSSIAVLPYLLLLPGRRTHPPPPTWIAILSGVSAGAGFCLKPYFLLSPLLVEGIRVCEHRSLRSAIRPESIMIAAFVAVYVLFILTITPSYVFNIVPLFRSIYFAFEVQRAQLIQPLLFTTVLISTTVALLPFAAPTVRVYLHSLMLGASGFAAAYLVQGKAYSYHLFPLVFFSALAATLIVLSALGNASRIGAARSTQVRLYQFLLLILLVLVFEPQLRSLGIWYRGAYIADGRFGTQTQQLIRIADRHAAGRRIYAFSTHPYPGFPVVCYSSANWGSRMNSQFVVPAIVNSMYTGGDSTGTEFGSAVAFQYKAVCEDFLRYKPQLVFVDQRAHRHAIGDAPFDFIEFFSKDETFAKIWSEYVEIAPVNDIHVYVRRSN